jgi:hypothetical protein
VIDDEKENEGKSHNTDRGFSMFYSTFSHFVDRSSSFVTKTLFHFIASLYGQKEDLVLQSL